MAILERRIQSVKQANEYWEWEKKWQAVEMRLGGFPPKRHYQLMSGRDESGTIVWEREWESFASAEATYTKMFEDAEVQALSAKGPDIIAGERVEFYTVVG